MADCPSVCACLCVCPHRYHKLTLTLLKASWKRAQQLVAARADAIRQVAKDMLAAESEQLDGPAVVKIIEVRGGLCGTLL